MTESVLRWRIVPPVVLAAQLDRIISISRLNHVRIGVVPLGAHQSDIANHSFVMRDDYTVTVETVHAETVVTDHRDVALYAEKFERFEQAALSGDAMRTFVAGVRDEFLQEQELG